MVLFVSPGCYNKTHVEDQDQEVDPGGDDLDLGHAQDEQKEEKDNEDDNKH
jgi:hypothetical protein